MMRKVALLALICSIAVAGCATTAMSDPVGWEGYLSAGPSPKLYETSALRDAGQNSECVQIIRPEATQTAAIPVGRVRVVGTAGEFDGDLVRLQMGQDLATDHRCEGRYILRAEITPLPEK